MLPHADDRPVLLAGQPVGLAIALDVPRKLRSPVARMSLWMGAVDRATMPEAPIDEYDDLATDPHYIAAPANSWQAKVEVQPVAAQTPPPQLPPQLKFWLGVPTSSHYLHTLTDLDGRRE